MESVTHLSWHDFALLNDAAQLSCLPPSRLNGSAQQFASAEMIAFELLCQNLALSSFSNTSIPQNEHNTSVTCHSWNGLEPTEA